MRAGTRTTTRRWPSRLRGSIGKPAPLSLWPFNANLVEGTGRAKVTGLYELGGPFLCVAEKFRVSVVASGVSPYRELVAILVRENNNCHWQCHLRFPLSVGGFVLRTVYRGCQVATGISGSHEPRQRAISPPSTRSLRGCPSCGGSGVEPGSDRPCGSCDGEGLVEW